MIGSLIALELTCIILNYLMIELRAFFHKFLIAFHEYFLFLRFKIILHDR